MFMNIKIEDDHDLLRSMELFHMSPDSKVLKYIYRIPGHRCYINILKSISEVLYLEIIYEKKSYFFKWELFVKDYVNAAREFGFSLGHMKDEYLLRSYSFKKSEENALIEKLLTISQGVDYMAAKYGLK